MALVLNDRVKETTTTTGTGTVNLAGAETGFETFVAGIGNSNTCYYAIVHQSAAEFEVGLGTVTDASPDTLARTTVISSSNSDSAVNFSSGTKDVFCTLPASKAVFLNSSADINLADDTKILLGAGDDLQIYHDGSNSYVVDNGTGGLVLRGTNTVDIQSALGHNYLKSTISAGTQIYHDNSEKFATVSGGVKVTGDIANASGNMTIDVADDLTLDADGEHIRFKDGGTEIGNIDMGSQNLNIRAVQSDKDILFLVNDGGSEVTALLLDGSDAGTATFNHDVRVGDNSFFIGGAGDDITMSSDGTNGIIQTGNGSFTVDCAGDIILDADGGDILLRDAGTDIGKIQLDTAGLILDTVVSDKDFFVNGNDGGSAITAIRVDMSDAGALICNGNITAFGSPSDIRLKENIEVIPDALDKVKQLKGVTFNYKKDGKKSTGLIAQDLEKVLPEVVYETSDIDNDEEKHLAVRYGNTVGLLVEAIKELEARVKELEDK